ncbi:hypothetical protein WN55_06673 [Dufourea novaeangliae]|uniref:Histone-lysine N-methyltransferase SETMAR n=1 Tax=Dufourea novaeangliae TaxID=178035 RepID=A0A154P3F8_DUFNO|nr:hypothetical protein WN55_06673 [Dufourea novaeangliae]
MSTIATATTATTTTTTTMPASSPILDVAIEDREEPPTFGESGDMELVNGPNPWLPAYGFQLQHHSHFQPTHEDFRANDIGILQVADVEVIRGIGTIIDIGTEMTQMVDSNIETTQKIDLETILKIGTNVLVTEIHKARAQVNLIKINKIAKHIKINRHTVYELLGITEGKHNTLASCLIYIEKIPVEFQVVADSFPIRQDGILETSFFLQQKVLFTDEATFTNRGKINLRNLHYWASENPHTKYSNFLRDILPTLLENVPLNIRTDIWYQHDGCPAHYAHVARQVLDRQLPNRWIGRGGEFLWPPRSPNLTPLNYFLWGTLKDMVYREPITTPENMKERIREACSMLAAGTIQNAVSSLINRLHQCINMNEHHFEHLR